MSKKGKYLYCIIKQPAQGKFTIKGVGEGKVYAISQGKLSAVVSDTEIKEYLPTRENVIIHQKVIEKVLEKHTLLPISFSTVAQSSDEVRKILKNNTSQILKILEGVEGKIELSLKVFWQNMSEIFKEIVKENREIQKAKAQQVASRNVMLKIGEMVARALEKKKNKEAIFILRPLLKIAQEVKKNELLRDDMLLNANFLVERSKEKNFDKVVNELDKKYGQRVKFKYVGPIAPFNFVEIYLKV